MNKLNILILDDDSRIRKEIVEFLNGLEYKCFEADRPSSANDILSKNEIDLMIADINLPEMDGLTFLQEIKSKLPGLEVIVITGYADVDKAVQALRLGAIDFLNKPFRLADLGNAIFKTKRYFEISNYAKLTTETLDVINRELNKSTAVNFIGNSEAAKKIIHDIKQVAQSSDTSVLITGESGTGKELAARSIHLLSERANHPFIAINSSAVTETLFESEMFGYKKGAFTGAIDSRAGWFEMADKGTVFFDEISEMNLNLQSKLLRVLEDKKVRRIGSEKETEVNVRVISASNQNFDDIVKQNKFRQDLYYRLAVFVIHLLPLRERRDDIPQLVEYYIKYFSEKMNKKILHINNDVFEILKNYFFPGNIRELRNICERAVILCRNDIIHPEHFDTISKQGSSINCEENFDLELNEKNLILKALEKSGNNKSVAAKLLNITWQSLDRRLTKFNIM